MIQFPKYTIVTPPYSTTFSECLNPYDLCNTKHFKYRAVYPRIFEMADRSDGNKLLQDSCVALNEIWSKMAFFT